MKKLIEVFLPLVISFSLFAESPAIVIHGGAGWFSNMSPNEIKDLKIMHYDLYRIKKAEELEHLGIFSENEKTIKIVEWPDLIKTPLTNKLEVHLEYGKNDNERKMNIHGLGKWKNFENEI